MSGGNYIKPYNVTVFRRKNRNEGLANWDDLNVIFTGKFACGKFASSTADFNDNESKHEDSDDGSLSPTQFLEIVNRDAVGDLDVVGFPTQQKKV